MAGLAAHHPDAVVDLSDEPVVDDRIAAAAGVPGARRAASRTSAPTSASIRPPDLASPPSRRSRSSATGKRTGKTAVSAHLARLLAEAGRPPVVVAMGRGGPARARADRSRDRRPRPWPACWPWPTQGRHAASDHLEDALLARVATVGTRRCGGGLFGRPFDATFAAGVAVADTRPESLMILEGSGPGHPAGPGRRHRLHGGRRHRPGAASPATPGAYRLLLSDAVVITMVDEPTARSGAVVAAETLERSIRDLAPGARIVHTVFRPTPLIPVAGRRIVFATTAPEWASPALREHIEREHGGVVVGVSHHLANRPQAAGRSRGDGRRRRPAGRAQGGGGRCRGAGRERAGHGGRVL